MILSLAACGTSPQQTEAASQPSSEAPAPTPAPARPSTEAETEPEEVPVAEIPYQPAPFWLEAEETNLLKIEDGIVRLQIYLPSDEALNGLSLCAGDEELLALNDDNTSKDEERPIRRGQLCDRYSLALEESRLNGDQIYLSLRRADTSCTPVMLYRPLLLTEEDLKQSYEVLCELGEMAQAAADKGEAIDEEAVLRQAEELLQKNEAVAAIRRQENMLFYTLQSGMTSFFSVGEADGTLSSGGHTETGDNTAPFTPNAFYVSGDCDPQDYFVRDTGFRDAVINPNLLVMAPVRSYENIINVLGGAANGEAEEELATNLAAELEGGNVILAADDDCSLQTVREWQNYGFVALNCHGPGDNGLLTREGRPSDATYFIVVKKMWLSKNDEHFQDFISRMHAWGVVETPPKDNYNLFYNTYGFSGIKLEYTEDRVSTLFAVVVTSDYLMEELKNAEFPNTVFLFDVCNGCSDTMFDQFLLDHGASAVIGFQQTINATFAKAFFRGLYDFFIAEESRSEVGFRSVPISRQNLSRFYKAEDPSQSWQGKGSLMLRSLANKAHVYKNDSTEFCLQGETTLKGIVSIPSSGRRLKDQPVDLYRWYNGTLSLFRTANTDKDGVYTFKEVPFGCYMLHTACEGEHTMVNLNAAGKEVISKDLDIPLIRVDVAVLDQFDQPIGGAEVVLEHAKHGSNTAAAMNREDGQAVYRLEEMKPDSGYTLTVSAEGYLSEEMQLTLAKDPLTAQYTVHLKKLGEFHAQVVDKESGEPISGAEVMLECSDLIWNGLSAEDGKVLAGNLKAGEYTVTCKVAGYKPVTLTVPIEYDTVTVLLYTIEMEKEDLWLLVAEDYQDIAHGGLWSKYMEYSYDKKGRLIEIGDLHAAEDYRYYDYGKDGRLAMMIKGTSGSTWAAEKYEYDEAGRVIKIMDYTLSYDGVKSRDDWKKQPLTDNGWLVRFYDGDLLVKEDHFAQNGSFLYGKVYVYDQEGRVIEDYEVDEQGVQKVSEFGKRYRTTYQYDQDGRLIEDTYYGSRIVTTQYEYTDGRLTKKTNLYTGYVTYFHYDENGNLEEDDTYANMGRSLSSKTRYYYKQFPFDRN